MKKNEPALQPLTSLSSEMKMQFALISKKKRLLVAVSGGADSVALLHLLLEAGYKNLVVAHFDHGLRGGTANADARFVGRLAAKLSLDFEVGSGDVRKLSKDEKLSMETAARQARYGFLAAVAKKHRTRSVVLAHHADDQVETCFFQFLRGSGAAGLAGMKSRSQRTISGITLTLLRPLLSISKHRLLDYLKERKVRHREDASNAVANASRNKLRLRVLPLIEKLFGSSFRASIVRNAAIFADEEDFLSNLALPFAAHAELEVKILRQLHPAIQRRVLHAWLKNRGIEEPGFTEVARTASLLHAEGPAKINLPGNRHARRKAGLLFVE